MDCLYYRNNGSVNVTQNYSGVEISDRKDKFPALMYCTRRFKLLPTDYNLEYLPRRLKADLLCAITISSNADKTGISCHLSRQQEATRPISVGVKATLLLRSLSASEIIRYLEAMSKNLKESTLTFRNRASYI